MQNPQNRRSNGQALLSRIALATLCAVCAANLRSPALAAQDSKKNSDVDAGIVLKTQATSKEVGLPIYPGARPHKDEKNDSAAANLGLWGSTFGFKLVVMKMESADTPERVAAFYRKALGKYGHVLDCSGGNVTDDKDSKKLTCDDDKPEPGKLVFKSGTKEKQHVVGIQHSGSGSLFQLVYIEAHGDKEAQ